MIMRFFSVMKTGTRHAKSVWYHVFHRSGVLGVERNYFHWRFFFRELAEVVCQSVRVFSASRLVPSQWINRVFVGVVVGNCVSTPTIQYCCQRFRIQKQLRVSLRSRTRRGSIQDTHVSIPVARRSRMFDSLVLERILCVVMDIALDMCSSMIIPVVLFQPYYAAFDLQALTFGVERLYDGVWYVTMVRVMQQVCVVSWLDLVLTWIPHYSIYASLHLLVGLVRPPLNRTIEPRARIHQSQEDEHSPTISGRHTDVMKKASHNRPSAQAHRRRCEFARSETHKVKWLWAAQSLIVTWGLILLASFIFSGYVQNTTEIHNGVEWGSLCKVQVRSWFTRKLACSVLYLDCFQHTQHQNTSFINPSEINDAIEVVLKGVEQPIVAVVVFAHCPALQMSPLLQNFRNLVGMEIFNSTIVEWPKSASLVQERHPQIGYLIISRSNFTSFPGGLRGPLPHSLCDIEISTTNLTQLPSDLHERWTSVTTLYVEYSNLS